jgi:hypothetical protein
MLKYLAIAAVAAASVASAHAQTRQWYGIDQQEAVCTTMEQQFHTANLVIHNPYQFEAVLRQMGGVDDVKSVGAGDQQTVVITGRVFQTSQPTSFIFFSSQSSCLSGLNYAIRTGMIHRPSDLQ